MSTGLQTAISISKGLIMDKIKLQQQVNELKTKLAEMEAELAKPEVNINYWQPVEGDNFYYADVLGNTRKGLANDDYTQRYRIFKTQEEAEVYAEYVKAEEALKAEIARLNEGWWPDWKEDQIQQKYYVRLYTKKLEIIYYNQTKTLPNFMHLKSKELAEQLIQSHSKELITYLSY